MTLEENKQSTPIIAKWTGEDRGDNLAFKEGLRVYTIDKYGYLRSQRYKRSQIRLLSDNLKTLPIEGLSDFKIGNTYSISQSDMVIGKLMESNLFGYRFLAINSLGKLVFKDLDYCEAVKLLSSGDIKQVLENVCDD